MLATLTLAGALMLDVRGHAERAPAPSPTATPLSQPRRYCIQGTPTGTRIARRDCRTRAEWLERGFDPLAPQE